MDDVGQSLGIADAEPVLARRDGHEDIAELKMSLVSVVELPSPVTVSSEGARAKGNAFEERDKVLVDEHPYWILGADGKNDQWDSHLAGNCIVDDEGVHSPDNPADWQEKER